MSYEICLLIKCDNLKPKRRWVKEIFQNILECFYSQMPDVFLSFLGKDFKLILISYSLHHIEYILQYMHKKEVNLQDLSTNQNIPSNYSEIIFNLLETTKGTYITLNYLNITNKTQHLPRDMIMKILKIYFTQALVNKQNILIKIIMFLITKEAWQLNWYKVS